MDRSAGIGPLAGITVVETGPGVAGAWCGRLLASLGAEVTVLPPSGGDPLAAREEIPGDAATRGLVHEWLMAGKRLGKSTGENTGENTGTGNRTSTGTGTSTGAGRSTGRATGTATGDSTDTPTPMPADTQLGTPPAQPDLLIIGEDHRGTPSVTPTRGTVRLSWFGASGPYAAWQGTDLVVQALSGVLYPTGPQDGAPRPLGDLHSALLGGVAGAAAALTALLARGPALTLDVSILETALLLGELQVADVDYYGRAVPRAGINRFSPTCPLSIHRCREGWLGVTLITPQQWDAFCRMIGRADLAENPDFATTTLREQRADAVEAAIDAALPARTAQEWAEEARRLRIPAVVVPDAAGILANPVFAERGAVAPVRVRDRVLDAPASPLHVAAPQGEGQAPPPRSTAEAPLAGLRIADFSMGWAGPLATRILADLGAEVIKIEAGRYPDWWRATQWTPEAIAARQFEKSHRFAAMNRGKRSVSFDLTTPEGADLARRLVAESDAVVENHAAGVIARLGLGWEVLSEGRDDLVMLSMSAFGTGNPLSDTRAYGSTLEQASGLPSFRGEPGEPPVLGHVAYGDPVGGLYGAVALLAALHHRQRTGRGQWLNLSQVEFLLPFAAAPVLTRSATGREPLRPGNGHVSLALHGLYPAAGDRWIAIAADEGQRRALSRLTGLTEATLAATLSAWTAPQEAEPLAAALQAAGIPAAPVRTPEEAMADPHLALSGSYHDTERPHLGRQRQVGLPFLIDGRRMPFRGTAPLLGGDTEAVMRDILGEGRALYHSALDRGIVSLEPTTLRGAHG
ncbi:MULTISPECIES: CaiB/BaiF CoA-transferase family protein [unclassified Haematobacter]|uniref:CaiB/BaiF CoA-transferase family protein n=1 Tax=unclassified Haematobacter TaxID=2640585 RepID=UPI0025BBCCBC|nr:MULTISPECIES: CoA transferase [unclassified Haematobacter]